MIWTNRLATTGAALMLAWLASVELGTSRTASATAKAAGNDHETVVDTRTGRLFDGAALVHLLLGLGASIFAPSTTIGKVRTATRPALYGAGMVLLPGSGLLSASARRHLGRFHRDDLTVHDNQTVVDSGPYRHVRHPIYLATAAALVGAGAILGNRLSIATSALPVAALIHRISVEEEMLIEHLGPAYTDYRSRTARLLPGIW